MAKGGVKSWSWFPLDFFNVLQRISRLSHNQWGGVKSWSWFPYGGCEKI